MLVDRKFRGGGEDTERGVRGERGNEGKLERI